MPKRTFTRTAELLSIIARAHPAIYDVIGDVRGPLVSGRWDLVALNPQPLPPSPDPFLVGAATMVNNIVRIAVEAGVRGESSAGWVAELVEDWCGTPWPRKWPWPWPGPRPDEGPFPEPWKIQAARVIGAIAFASAGTRLAEGELSAALLDGAERLAEAAVQEQR